MSHYFDIPAKVLECAVQQATGQAYWPHDNGLGDPFWAGGAQPTFYRWTLDVQVSAQTHSSNRTRKPRAFTGMDVRPGDYIASVQDGVALRVVSVEHKTDDFVRVVVEDVFRYNTFRDGGGQGVGIFTVPSAAILFETNEDGLPVLDPVPASGLGASFYPNLMSRFLNFDKNVNFVIEQERHGFAVGALVSADPVGHRFTVTSSDHPLIVGTVTYTDLGPNHFMLNPLQKVVDDYPYMAGAVGDVLYADDSRPGALTTAPGNKPVLIKLRDHTPTATTGLTAGASTEPGGIFLLNGVAVTVGGSGSMQDFIDAVNAGRARHGVAASRQAAPTRVATTLTLAYGEPGLYVAGPPPALSINGTAVAFTTTATGQASYGDTYALEEDMAADINAAAIPGIRASTRSNALILENLTGGPVTLVNLAPDGNGNPVAGDVSGTGLPLFAAGGSDAFVRLAADDARAIDLYETSGTPVQDFGLFSVDNGVKAAALYIEQGIRKASTTVVSDLAARNALTALLGDQAHVLDKGDGEWGLYLHNGSRWVQIATEESAKTDSDTYEAAIDHRAGSGVLGEIGDGSRVGFVTVRVLEAFDGAASLTIGDDGDPARLMGAELSDLSVAGDFTATPAEVFMTGGDTVVKYYLTPNGASRGRAQVSISYS